MAILALAFALVSLRRCRQLRREISRRLEVEEQLLRFRETLENMELIAVRLDTAGKITFCNDYFLRLVGWSRQEVLGANWFDRFIPLDQGTVKRFFSSGLTTGAVPAHFQNDIVTRDGSRRFISWTNTVLMGDDGASAGTMSIGEDITDRTAAENTLSRYQEELRSLAAELSLAEERERRRLAADLHDRIGQTLAFTKIRTDSLRQFVVAEGAETLRETAALLEQSIQEVRTLIFQISPPLLYEVGLEAALEWLAETFQEEHGLTVSFQDDGEVKPLAEEVKVTLFQAVREILINTVKHARATRATIAVRAGAGQIVVDVRDDGAGFEAERAVDISRSRSLTGFGLFNIRQRLERLGGELLIVSAPGRGTAVTVIAQLLRDASAEEGAAGIVSPRGAAD
ncbi:PAS domain-containing sensor histidine kinase [Geobacter pickeringii]|uniref:PAS domain-containing sensor histidine kinase n=1 Tax=Geobacter pickeringii TaxID=345632 RepID=UPI001F18E576|nr:PAS domain S-box protein [Geobacter pickeringii]